MGAHSAAELLAERLEMANRRIAELEVRMNDASREIEVLEYALNDAREQLAALQEREQKWTETCEQEISGILLATKPPNPLSADKPEASTE